MIGRDEEISKFKKLLQSPALFPSFLLVGPPKSGKSLIMNQVISSLTNIKSAHVSCLGASIRLADIFEQILDQLGIGGEPCLTFPDFVCKLNKLNMLVCNRRNSIKLNINTASKVVIVLTNADRLRSLDPFLLPGIMKLNELVDEINISVVLVSKLPWSKWRLTQYMASSPPVQVFVKPYSRSQLRQILASNFEDINEPQILKDNFIEMILSVFQQICKSLLQFKRAAELLWPEYVKATHPPPGVPRVEPDNARALLRSVEPHMKRVLLNIHYQESSNMMGEESKSIRLNVELPFFSKFLLLASFLASYNPISTDKRFFVRGRIGRVVKKSKRKVQTHKKSSQLLGPKTFDLNRMLAIFYVIVDEKVTSTAEIQSQVASLVTLQMLTQSGEDLDQPKYKCNVSLDFIRQVAKNVRFELCKYLYDVEN